MSELVERTSTRLTNLEKNLARIDACLSNYASAAASGMEQQAARIDATNLYISEIVMWAKEGVQTVITCHEAEIKEIDRLLKILKQDVEALQKQVDNVNRRQAALEESVCEIQQTIPEDEDEGQEPVVNSAQSGQSLTAIRQTLSEPILVPE